SRPIPAGCAVSCRRAAPSTAGSVYASACAAAGAAEASAARSLPHAHAGADDVQGIVAARRRGRKVRVLIARVEDGVAADVVVEAELGRQVTLVDGDAVVGVERVLDSGRADEMAPESMAHLEAGKPRQRARRARRRRVGEIRADREQEGGQRRGAPGEACVDDQAVDVAEPAVPGQLAAPPGADLPAEDVARRPEGDAQTVALPGGGAQDAVGGRHLELAVVGGGFGEYLGRAGERPARPDRDLTLRRAAFRVADDAAAGAGDRCEVDVGEGAAQLQREAIEAVIEGRRETVGRDVAAGGGSAG